MVQGAAERLLCKGGRDAASPDHSFFFFFSLSTDTIGYQIKHVQTNSALTANLLIFAPFQGWVFNVVPWLVAIPTSLFSGFLSDNLINQGKSFSSFSSALTLCDVERGPGWRRRVCWQGADPANRQREVLM